MRHLEEYELFEALAQPNMEAIRRRIADRFARLARQAAQTPTSPEERAKKWIKTKYDIDLGAFLEELTSFITKASSDQIPNILRGVKGEDFAKYIDPKVISMLKDTTKKAFTTGGAKGKAGMIRTAYVLGGKKGLVKDAFKEYKAKKLTEGATALIDTLTGLIYRLGTDVSQGMRLDPAGSSDELPEMKPYSAAIRKWEDGYDSYFSDRDKILMTYLDAVATAVWESKGA